MLISISMKRWLLWGDSPREHVLDGDEPSALKDLVRLATGSAEQPRL
jgi:hypothetical protein